eukprot:TRINITY_DN5540_c0_g1_i10.p1 TRINITY_DN5540_c0_g1~~TRINITY_DN5540_c0_g1_i10.p1  ORF type:complete len:610 (-),score=38.29 TRINITY_DN5540_c0_g1_i10:2184-4013(-)
MQNAYHKYFFFNLQQNIQIVFFSIYLRRFKLFICSFDLFIYVQVAVLTLLASSCCCKHSSLYLVTQFVKVTKMQVLLSHSLLTFLLLSWFWQYVKTASSNCFRIFLIFLIMVEKFQLPCFPLNPFPVLTLAYSEDQMSGGWTLVDNQVSLTCMLQTAKVQKLRHNAFAVMELSAPATCENVRPTLVLTTVLDRSGSMGKGKLAQLKLTMHFIREQLQTKDGLGIIAYDHEVQERVPIKIANSFNQGLFQREIDDLQTGGSTNISGALIAAIEQQAKTDPSSNEAVRAILLCTDGLANIGITDADELCKCIKTLMAKVPNLHIHTFGFGADHDNNILQKLAETGQGTYSYVENDDCIPEAFGLALGSLLSVGAQNVRVKIVPLVPSFKVIKIWDKVVSHKTDETGVTEVELRDLLGEIQQRVLFEYSLDETEHSGLQDIARIELSCYNVLRQKMDFVTHTLQVDRQDSVPEDQPINQEVTKSMVRVQTFKRMSIAKQEADQGNFAKAQMIINQAIEALKSSKVEDQEFLRSMESDLVELLQGFSTREMYKRSGRFYSSSILHSHASQGHRYISKDKQKALGDSGFQKTTRMQQLFRDRSINYQQEAHQSK